MRVTTNIQPVSNDRNEKLKLVQELSRTGEMAGRIASAAFETANLVIDENYKPAAVSDRDRPYGLPAAAGQLGRFMIEDFRRMRAAWPELEQIVKPVLELVSGAARNALVNRLLKILMKANPCYLVLFSDLYHEAIRNGSVRRLINHLEETAAAWREPACQLVLQHPLQEITARSRQIQSAEEKGIPGILFNTMPKSGSMFISNGLCQGLNLTYLPIAIADHPLRDHVISGWAGSLVGGGAISQEHIPATHQNITALKAAGIEKIVVHLRDPRQALLSNLHHFTNRREEMLMVMEPFLPDEFWQWPFESRADWMIENFFGELVQWAEGWLDVAEAPEIGIKVCFTHYEDLHGREEKIFRTILDFHGMPDAWFKEHGQLEKSEKTHFRKGLIDEWREGFTPDQQQRLNSLIPSRLIHRFGWPPS